MDFPWPQDGPLQSHETLGNRRDKRGRLPSTAHHSEQRCASVRGKQVLQREKNTLDKKFSMISKQEQTEDNRDQKLTHSGPGQWFPTRVILHVIGESGSFNN